MLAGIIFRKNDEKFTDEEKGKANNGTDTILNKESKRNLMWHLKNMFVLEDEE